VAGASIVPAVIVEARDDHANVDPTFTSLVTLEFVNNAGSPVLGTLSGATATASLGIATFPTLSVNKVGTGYTIRAAASGGAAASATSSAFNITPGLANNLAFTVQPTQTTVGANISPAVRVTVRDINDNTVTNFSGNVVVAITLPNAPGGTLGGTLTKAAVAGVATFSALDIDVAGSYQLTATSTGLTPATSVAFNIITSVATQLVFTVHPKTTTAGALITGTAADVEVTARDASGQTASGFTGDIVLSITPGTGTPGAVLGGTTTATAGGGSATFPNIFIEKSGSSYKLTASAALGAPPTAATSGFFSITHDAAVNLVYQVQPSNATINAAITPPVEVKAVDQFGNTATGFTDNVSVAITPNPSGGVLSGTLTKAAVQGVATFTNLSIDQPSFLGLTLYELNATTPAAGVAGVTSNLFDITSSASNRLVVTAQPPSPTTAGAGFSVQVTAQDAVGNPLIGFANDVTLSITAGTGTNGATLSGSTTVTPVSGVANFSGLSIDKSGFGYTLSATATNIAGATTASFAINAGAASQVDFIVDPTTTGAGLAIQPAVQVEVADALGNRVTNFVGDVTVAIFTNPSGGTLSGTATAPVSTGIATFNNLSIDAAGTGYRLQASSGALTTDVSSAFSIIAGTATQLIFTVAPSNQTAGLAISPAIRVTALDALGNVAPTFGGDVTLDITDGTGDPLATLGGLLTQTASLGVATFPGLSIDKAAVGYTLSATTTTPAVTGTTSATFTITHGAATHLVFTVQPSNTAANASITPAVQVTARDQFENLVTAFVGDVTVAMGTNAGGPGSILSGTLIRPVTNGVATFDDLSINNVGIGYTLTAQTGGLPLAGSAAFNIF
jgi:NADH/NAD ratio-sensing transcriptional regulator Rex